MKRLFSAKSLMAAALALGAIGATSMAQAQHNDGWHSIAVGEPYGHQQPAPDYRNDRFDRHDRFDRRGPMADADRDGIPNRFDRDSRFYDARATFRSAEWGDWDRDGVVNRFDRFSRNHRRS